MRQFKTGATRDEADHKPNYEGFLSPAVLMRYAEFMHAHRHQRDGKLRRADNWQRGIPLNAYASSGVRHVIDWWAAHRGLRTRRGESLENVLCAVIFNAGGYLFELLKARKAYCPKRNRS